MPAVRLMGASITLALAASVSPTTVQAETAKPPKLTADDVRYSVQVTGQCTQVVAGEPQDPAQCAKEALRVEYMDGRHAFRFTYGDTEFVFVSPSNTNTPTASPDTEQLTVTQIRLFKPGSPSLTASATGHCQIVSVKADTGPVWRCSARRLQPSERVEFEFRHGGKGTINFDENFPRAATMTPALFADAPAALIVELWKADKAEQAGQVVKACHRQAAYVSSVALLFQCLGFRTANDYLIRQSDPKSDEAVPEIPAAINREYADRLRALLRARGRGDDAEKDVAFFSGLLRSIYAGTVWRVREAYGSTRPGQSSITN